MAKMKYIFLTEYISIFVIWVVLNLSVNNYSLLKQIFILFTVFFVLSNSLVLLLGTFKYLIRLRATRSILFFLLGIFLVSISNIFNIQIYSMFDVIVRLLSYSSLFIGALHLPTNATKSEILVKFLSIFSIYLFVCWIFSGIWFNSTNRFDFLMFSLYSYPLGYVIPISLLIIFVMQELKNKFYIGSLIFFIVGLGFYLISDLVLFYSMLFNTHLSPLSHIFLSVTGGFLSILSMLGYLELKQYNGEDSKRNIIYFRDITYRIPIGLN